jgi:beta-phosphoglucomutase
MIKCILFDLDGVLVDACEWHYLALNNALYDICKVRIDYQDHILNFNGLPTSKKLEILLDRNYIKDSDMSKIWDLKQKKTIDIISRDANIDLLKIQMLKDLKSSGLGIGCVTNSIEKTAKLMLLSTGQYEYIDLLITNEDVKMFKPDPEGYVAAMKKFSCMPAQTLIIEDSEKGCQAAISSGAHLLRVKNPSHVNIEAILNKINEIERE